MHFVLGIGAFEKVDFAFTFKGKDMGADAVEEPTVMANDDCTSCKGIETFFEGTDAGYRFVYLTDACAGVDADSERAVQTILQGLSPLHVELMTTAEYIAER